MPAPVKVELLLLLPCLSPLILGDVNIDLREAFLDPDTGNFCVMQKVCVSNPPEALTSSGCAPQFPPGCECDPAGGPEADSFCPADRPSCVQCKCLPAGCSCDPSAPDPDSFCPGSQVCKDCQCTTPLPPGCECDPVAGPDNLFMCPAERPECVQCKCLPAGCTCDPSAPNPDSFCPSGDVCKDCRCEPALPPGCECNPNSQNPDELCPADLRCVGCKCQNCPQSGGQGQGQRKSQVFNPPLVFVIDTTKSVKPDQDSIFNLTRKVTDRIMKDGINIPRYQLVTFNDFGPAINLNVKLEVDTDSVMEFARATSNIVFESYNGGRDSKERLTQGLLVALQNASPKSLIVVFTDNGTKDLRLERDIVHLRQTKEVEIFIVLTPVYEGKFNGKSLPAYGRMGKVFLIEEVGADSFLRTVETFEENNCV